MNRLRRGKRKVRQGQRRVRIGAPDRSLTGLAGLVAVDELIDRLGIVRELDRRIAPIKVRDRGLTGGQLVAGMATGQLAGADCLAGLDRVRADAVASVLSCAPIPESRTAGRLAGMFDAGRLAGIESALAAVYRRWLALVPAEVRAGLVLRDPTIDLDASDIEVFGPSKEPVGWNYTGMRCGRVHLASWAQAELPLAADLIAGNDDPRPDAPDLLRRALACMPPQVCGRPRVRADAGYFDGGLAHAAVEAGCDFAIAAKRNPAAWRALGAVGEHEWSAARGMPGGQVAACDYAPAGGQLDHVWAVSFIVTNIPANHGDYAGLEAWFRRRTSIEDRFREGKHGAGLIHLPSASKAVNSVWMWAGLLAGALAVMLQSITGLDRGPHRSAHRVRIATLRHQLLAIPGRLTTHARTPVLRLPPHQRLLPVVLARLRALPAPT